MVSGEGGHKTKMKEHIVVECDICKRHFADLDDFEQHWLDEHAVNYGPRSYKKIIYWKEEGR